MTSLAILLTSLLTASAAQAVQETRPAAVDGAVQIASICGSVVVKGWDKKELSITGHIDEGATLEIEGSAERWYVEVDPNNSKKGGCGYLEIHVPRSTKLGVEVVSTEIDVAEVTGNLNVESVSGSIDIEGTTGEIGAETISGAVDVQAMTRSVDIESVSGSITLGDSVQGKASATSISGNIEASGGPYDRVELETVSGNIKFKGRINRDARLDLTTHSGDITLAVPNLDAEVEVSTFSGSIVDDYGHQPNGSGGPMPGKELRFSLGSASADASLETFSGKVHISKP